MGDPPPDFTIWEGSSDNERSRMDINDSGFESTNSIPNNPFDDRESYSSAVDDGVPIQSDSMAAFSTDGGDISQSNVDSGASWMERNNMLPSLHDREANRPEFRDGDNSNNDNRRNQRERRQRRRTSDSSGVTRTFRQDFRGTRVFVQGIPEDASWQDLKDHFRIAGEVVFASVSRDAITGESKGHGVVQFETTDMAQTAIAIMRDHPLNGQVLFVREDAKQERLGATLSYNSNYNNHNNNRRAQMNNRFWSCADEENSNYLSDSDLTEVLSLIRARDDARRRRNYDVSDNIREELKLKYGVHLDDRLKMWWVSMDGDSVPQTIQDIKGGGRWNKRGPEQTQAWRQIPTTPENDTCVDPDLVYGLLAQRDIARREKDYQTADALLEQARNAPDGDLYLRIHDESRTWRIWTDEPPPKPFVPHMSPAERCIAIVEEHAPEKVGEVQMLLDRFVGREYSILKRLKQRYLEK